jgi:hypothetical protein
MKDDSRFGRILRRAVASTFVAAVFLWAAAEVVRLCVYLDLDLYFSKLFSSDDDKFYLSQRLSDDVLFYDSYYYGENGYIANADGKKLIKNVLSIHGPLEGDSLVYYSDGERRGYFHMRDGHVVVKPIYEHAWIFSEGLAAVEQHGRIKFIDTQGNIAIDRGFGFNVCDDGYVFHNGHCAVNDSLGRHKGLIDRKGDWVLPPVYDNISPYDTFWVVSLGDQQALLSFSLDTIMPFARVRYDILDTAILVSLSDHSLALYSRQGTLLKTDLVVDVEQMMYDTKEVVYNHTDHSADETTEYYEYDDTFTQLKAVATCLRYEAQSGWYGLMSPEGRQLTPPLYISIQAIDKDLYLCKPDYYQGILLDSHGRRVE